MNIPTTHVDGKRHKDQRLSLVRLQQNAKLRKQYVAQIPGWRRPAIGYLLTIPCVGLAILLLLAERSLLPSFYFPVVLLILSVLVIALIWGVGPALFAVLLSTIALDYFYIYPYESFNFYTVSGALQLLPFIIAGFIIAVITGQRESARLHALLAEQEAQEHVQELERKNQELAETNQLKDQFISMASHELKTPITTIRGQAQIMLRRLARQRDLPQELVDIRSALEKIDGQTYRLTALVDDLLELSSLRAGKAELRLSSCDLRDVCRSVIEDQRLLTGRTIELEAPPAVVLVRCDSDRLSQVVTNLVNNAIKYSSEDSPVQVKVCKQDNKTALITVHDSGVGIPKEQQAHIFDTFYRAPDAQTSSKSGWGLGLAICKDIVERHHGRIWCESQPGDGSTFFVELPLK